MSHLYEAHKWIPGDLVAVCWEHSCGEYGAYVEPSHVSDEGFIEEFRLLTIRGIITVDEDIVVRLHRNAFLTAPLEA